MSTSERDFGEAGLRESMNRLRGRVAAPDTADPTITAGEVLGWCYALETHHRDRLGDPAYFTRRSASVDGEILAGLLYARGLFAHGLAATAGLFGIEPARTTHVGSTLIVTGGRANYFWKPITMLPQPGKPETHGRDALYQKHIERQPLLPPLERAVTFLFGIP